MWSNEDLVVSLGKALRTSLELHKAVRLGESTVISRSVHVLEVERPQQVKVVTTADAGQVFYGRTLPGTIYHIDVFHAVGQVNHRAVAAAIIAAIRSCAGEKAGYLLDRMDLQTGTGGGRVSGSLNFGRRSSVRRAHANHVHVAAELDELTLPYLVPLVAAVEKEILHQGIEIRKVEKAILVSPAGGASTPADLSPYASETDSRLREEKRGSEQQTRNPSGTQAARRQMEQALTAARETLPPEELYRLLRSFPLRHEETHKYQKRWGDLEHTLAWLEGRQLIKRERGRFVLTDSGHELSQFLAQRLPELESSFRQMLRQVPLNGVGQTSLSQTADPATGWHGQIAPRLAPSVPGAEIDLAATAMSAAKRWFRGKGKPGTLEPADIKRVQLRHRQQIEIILVVDTSASMAGERLRAARFLAEHLVLATRDKVAVIAFQEQDVLVPPGFSRHLSAIQHQLLALRAYGLTPLAKALRDTAGFIAQTRAKRPLVFLITDGIPTVPLAGGDPAEDALAVAAQLSRMRLEFICIGLDPNRQFLAELSRHGGGRLHIIQELEPSTLARLVHSELGARARQGAR